MTVSGVVDLHAHVVLDGAFGAAGSYGPEHGFDGDGLEFFRVGQYTMKPIPYRGSVFMDVERRLAEMDRVGIDRQMLSPNPLTFLGGVEPAPAIEFARATNDSMAALVATHPERLLGAAHCRRHRAWRLESVGGRAGSDAHSNTTGERATRSSRA